MFLMAEGAQIPDSNLLLGKPGQNTTIETRDGGTLVRDQAASTWTASDKLISPVLEANSTSEASNPCPPMTQAQIDTATASDGGCVYNTDRKALNIYDAGTSSFKAVQGGGGAGGDGINGFGVDENPNAESGTDGWTASAGTFDVNDTDPLEGDQSFIWTPAAQNDTLTSSVLDFDKDAFKGRACEARIEAIGGDDNLTVQVINGNNAVVGEKQYKAQSIAAPFSVYFRCPSQAKITADAQKGNLRLRFLNEGASASPLIKWDLSYLGTLKGLVEVVLPDSISAIVEPTDQISSENVEGFFKTVTRSSGTITVTFEELENIPSYQLTIDSGASTLAQPKGVNVTTSSISWEQRDVDNILVSQDFPWSITITKSGSDAKQTAQVFYNIPKVSENLNEFNAYYDASEGTVNDSVKGQEPEVIIETVSKSGTTSRQKNFTVNTGAFSETPHCEATGNAGSVIASYLRASSSPTLLVFDTTSAGTSGDFDFSFECTKKGNDFKTPTVQPTILRENAAFFEGETDSFITGYASFGGASDGDACSSSPCTRYRDEGIGSNMSAARSGTGGYDMTVTGFKPNSNVSCFCVGAESSTDRRQCQNDNIGLAANSSGEALFEVTTESIGGSGHTNVDTYFTVQCTGPKPL